MVDDKDDEKHSKRGTDRIEVSQESKADFGLEGQSNKEARKMIVWNGHGTCPKLATLVLLVVALASSASAQNHDLVLQPAPNITSPTNSTNWHSSDIKVGADFGDASIPDIVRRGVTNPLFARFYINGVLDHTVPSGSVEIRFHYRNALVGETPPALTAPGSGWNLIGSLPVTYAATDPPFILTKTWPTDYPSVTTKHVDWLVPASGSHFHIRAEAVYPSGTSDDNPGDNVAISLYDSILGMRDVDVVVVHDVSGSMVYYTYAGDTYLAQAKSRAQAFVLSMNESHRLAVVAFGGCLTGGVADIWGTPVPPLKDATWLNKIAAAINISANVTVPNTGCMTPMGVGVERAIQILTSVPADPTRKRAILLLTDGYENSGTPRACPDTDPSGPCIGAGVLAQLQANDIRVFSIALGTSAWTDCLECITTETDGQWYATPGPGIDLAQVYLDMQQTYSADDLYRADVGTTGGGDDSYSTYFEGLDDVLYFILQSDDLSAEIKLEIQPPGSGWQSPDSLAGASVQRNSGYVVARVEKPASGAWGYRVLGEPRQGYLVAVRSDRVGARLAFDVKSKGIVETPLFITAHLADRGKPIKTSGLTATVQIPADSSLDTKLRLAAREHMLRYGTWPIDPMQLRKDPDMDPRAAFVHKITDGQQHKLMKTRVVKVELHHQADGTYTGVLKDDTQIAGEYKVTLTYRDERADRVQSKSVRLAPASIDYQRSFAELLVLKGTRDERPRWVVRIYPVDEFGNAISNRSLMRDLQVIVKGAELVKKPRVAFDSAIEQWLRVPTRQAPVLERVSIGGKDLRIGRIKEVVKK
jgi:hypothetical protein